MTWRDENLDCCGGAPVVQTVDAMLVREIVAWFDVVHPWSPEDPEAPGAGSWRETPCPTCHGRGWLATDDDDERPCACNDTDPPELAPGYVSLAKRREPMRTEY